MPREIDTAIVQKTLASAPRAESGAIDLTKAKRFKEGGTHVLYRCKDAPYVIKVMKHNPNAKELTELERKYSVLYDCFDHEEKNAVFVNNILLS